MMSIKTKICLAATFSFATLCFNGYANDDKYANVEIKPTKLSDSAYMFAGAGGNIGVSVGADGIIIIDNQFAPLAGKISQALANIQPGLPRYIINTHYHGDHTGGNNVFGQTGTIFAHHNVLKRLSDDDSYKAAGLPTITYSTDTSIHANGDVLTLLHTGAAHTDGDSIVLWQDKSIVHMGDLFFKDRFPYIDLDAGGSVKGYRDAVAKVIRKINADTIVIPGHGSLATRDDLIRFKHMLDASINWMESNLANGASLEALQQQGMPEKWQDWGWRFISEERWIATLHKGLATKS
ncbi:MBL fold metallo-hydrolase [Shewanella waksmanii]|uniref:MBL fold metallo-hydrolase n=1 Tax=Shewanella waksmanii TaxID=213783 RepID=UPI003734FC59